MALFKILKGQEKNLPANKTEGWAYVTTDEGNMYVDVSASKRVRIGAHADKADVATKAEGDTKPIREIYLAKLKQVTSDGTQFTFRGETGNGTNAPDLISIPLAGDKAGLISNAAQTIKGEKTFANGIKFPDVTSTTYPTKSAGLTWAGSTDGAKIFYEVQASDKGMLVIESTDDANAGAIFRNSSSGKTVSIIDGVITGAFTGNLTGTANNAISDNAGKKITSYVYSVTKKSPTIFTVTKGDGTTNDIALDFLPTAGGTIHGELYADSITAGSLVVTGVARFANGLLGNLIGNVTGTATDATYAEKAKGDTTSIRSTYIASIKQVTSNGTTFTFRGYAGDGSEKADLITVPNASSSVAGLITTSAQSLKGNKTLDGQFTIQPADFAGNANDKQALRVIQSHQSGGGVGSSAVVFSHVYGTHDYGVVENVNIQSTSGDKPSIRFSVGAYQGSTQTSGTTSWSIGYCSGSNYDFRISKNHGWNGWGTEVFRLDTNGHAHFAYNIYDKNAQELKASLFIASLFQKTSNGTTFTFGGKNTAGTELSTLTIPNASTSLAGLITNSDQSIRGTKTLDDGMLIIKPADRHNWTEGIRILDANNGWTTFLMGGSATSGPNTLTWSMHTYQGNFYIAHNGSNSSTTGIFQSDANGNWRIDNSLGIGGKNAAYKLYVNGASYFDSTRDSTYSKDGNASIVTTGGVSIAGRVSANSVKIDNADSGTNTEGCIMKYNSTCKCIEFIFGI